MHNVVKKAVYGTVEKLTSREHEILELVSTGATNREIAAKLFISENTVKNHLKNIMTKLHIQNRVQLATYARETGQITCERVSTEAYVSVFDDSNTRALPIGFNKSGSTNILRTICDDIKTILIR